ncbi:MAG TPA: hypothetical protein VIS96_18250 [Terrimicrobiaceae bacterium]
MRRCAAWRLNNLAIVLMLVGAVPPKAIFAAAADISVEIGSRFESNASNSNKPSDRLADGFLTAHVDAGTNGVWGRDWRWRARISGEGEEAFRFNGLSQIEGGVRLGVDRKFGLGWKAPKLQLDVYSAFRGAGQAGASGFRLAPSLAVVWQITERGGVSVRYTPHWFFAQGALFDSAAQEAGISAWFDLFPKTRLFVNYSFRYGDVISYATPPRPDLAAIAEVRELTDVFGAERMAYRFNADTHSVQAGVDQDLNTHIRFRAMYRFEITQRGGLEYENHIAEIGLRVRF